MEQGKVTKTSEILRLFSEGLTVGQIAKVLDIRYQHVYNTLKMKNIELPVKNRENNVSSMIERSFRETGNITKTSKEVGKTYQHCYNVLRAKGLISLKS